MEDADSFKVDYAASDRSSCSKCKRQIGKGELRMAPLVVNPRLGDFKIPMWHHFPKCFEEHFMRKFAHKLTDVNQISGIDRLKFEDQQKLKSLVITADSKLAAKAVTAEEKQLAQESKALWALREKLDALETRELQDMLDLNKQPKEGPIFGGRGKLLDRCADGMLFGALPKCSVCKSGDMYCSHGIYKCTGNIDEFARCEWEGTDPERTEWKIPASLKEDHDFLDKFKFKAREKAAAISGSVAAPVVAPVVVAKQGDDDDDEREKQESPSGAKSSKKSAAAGAGGAATAKKSSGTRRGRAGDENDADNDDETGPANPAQAGDGSTPTPLTGIAVTCCGKLTKSQKEIEAEVKKLGGTFVKTAAGATVCIMTDEEASGKGTKKGKECVASKILCVGEDWLKEIVEAGRLVKFGDNVLANADKRAPIVRKSGADAVAVEARAKSLAAKKSAAADPNQAAKSDPIKKFIVKDGSAVHPDSGLQDKGKIYKSATGDVYNVMMNNTDVTTGANSYYMLQLIEHEDVRGRYSTYRKWGRLGSDIGSDKITQHANLASALSEFQKVYLDKTGNKWQDRKSFKKVAGRFMPVETDLTAENPDAAVGGSGAFSDASYRGPLDQATQSLIALMFDVKAMTAALKELEIDTEKMPLGRLSKNTITEGYRALADAENILNDPKFTDVDDPAWRARVVSVSNRFYNFIPHVVPRGVKLPLLSTAEILQSKSALLDSLQQLEVASKILAADEPGTNGSTADAAAGKPAHTHALDSSYHKLKTTLRTLDHKSDEFVRLETYLQNTHAATHNMYSLKVIDIWAIDREGEAERYKPFENDGNRQLLWHGSRLTNWIGILSQGLRIAPPEAPSTGYMFGKGVYVADASSKSANYCFTTSEKTTGLMALNEVALGPMKEFKRANFVSNLEKPYLSVKGVGRNAPDESGAFWCDDGTKIPMGKLTSSGVSDTTLLYNEYIVYNVAQIRHRYLFRIEFVYNRKFGTFF